MKTKFIWFVFSLIFAVSFFTACNPAEDKVVVRHRIVTNNKVLHIYKDTIPGAELLSKLNPGHEVFYPERKSNNWIRVNIQEHGSRSGYIRPHNMVSDTTIITHSSVLRDKYNQPKVAALDEKFDSIAIAYLKRFPIKKTNFWIFAIVIAIGIGTFYSISDTDIPTLAQILALLIYSPFALWVAFNIHQYGLSQIDGFLFRLIILLAVLALTVFMITGITASVGKFIGHKFTFKFCTGTSLGIYLVYFGIAFLHRLSDFFYKVAIFIYALFFLYYVVARIIHIFKNFDFKIIFIFSFCIELVVFFICILLVNVILIPMQLVSSILITHLSGLLLMGCMFVSFFSFLALHNSSGDSEEPYIIDRFYDDFGIVMDRKSDGYWYDQQGYKYKDRDGNERVSGKY